MDFRDNIRLSEEDRALFARILDLLPYAIFWKDLESTYMGCNVVFANNAGMADPAEIVGKNDYDLPWSQEEAEAYREDDAQVMRTGQAKVHIVETQETRDGKQLHIDTSKVPLLNPEDQVVGVLGVFADITDQRKNEIELAKTRQNLESALAVMDSGIVLYDKDERLVFCNDQYKEIYSAAAPFMTPGIKYEELLTAYARHHNGPDEDAIREFVKTRLESHREARGHWRQELPDRTIRVSDRRTPDGGIVSLRTDITNLTRIEKELRIARDQAEQASRAKSEFLANMSHEIRTPMAGILGFTELLLSDCENPNQAETLRAIQRNGEALLVLINDILDISKIEAGALEVEFEPVHLERLSGEALDLVRLRAEQKGVRLLLDVAPEVPAWISSDAPRVRQILVNLLSNAVKFTHEGTVSLRIRSTHEEQGHSIEIEVEDTGIGMTPDQRERVFHPFEQADSSTTRKYGGTGLGLTICESIAQLLGGGLSVESKESQGSRFTFAFQAKACEAPTDTPQPESRASESPARGGALQDRKILLAEDGRDNQVLISTVLRKAGAEVHVVENGRLAVEELNRAGSSYDLVLMDMQMPELDGYAATGTLREQGFQLPILALTANAMRGDRDRCLEAGCNDYLAKPIPFVQLVTTCVRWLKAAA